MAFVKRHGVVLQAARGGAARRPPDLDDGSAGARGVSPQQLGDERATQPLVGLPVLAQLPQHGQEGVIA
jgi:hypothetical protein